jgi:hypothetical protein
MARELSYKLLPRSNLRYFDDEQGEYGQNSSTVKANCHVRHIPVEKPSAPGTADPGLATTPPERLKLEEAQGENKNVPSNSPTSKS